MAIDNTPPDLAIELQRIYDTEGRALANPQARRIGIDSVCVAPFEKSVPVTLTNQRKNWLVLGLRHRDPA
jgi:hypothetical protein